MSRDLGPARRGADLPRGRQLHPRAAAGGASSGCCTAATTEQAEQARGDGAPLRAAPGRRARRAGERAGRRRRLHGPLRLPGRLRRRRGASCRSRRRSWSRSGTCRPEEIPAGTDARIDWLFDWWRTLDAWVGERGLGELERQPRARRPAGACGRPRRRRRGRARRSREPKISNVVSRPERRDEHAGDDRGERDRQVGDDVERRHDLGAVLRRDRRADSARRPPRNATPNPPPPMTAPIQNSARVSVEAASTIAIMPVASASEPAGGARPRRGAAERELRGGAGAGQREDAEAGDEVVVGVEQARRQRRAEREEEAADRPARDHGRARRAGTGAGRAAGMLGRCGVSRGAARAWRPARA